MLVTFGYNKTFYHNKNQIMFIIVFIYYYFFSDSIPGVMRALKLLLVITLWVNHSSAYGVGLGLINPQRFKVHAEGLNFINEDTPSCDRRPILKLISLKSTTVSLPCDTIDVFKRVDELDNWVSYYKYFKWVVLRVYEIKGKQQLRIYFSKFNTKIFMWLGILT